MSSKTLLMEVVGEDLYQDFETGLGITINSPDGFVYRLHKINDRSAHVSRRSGTNVEKGQVSGDDIYDVVASFIMSIRLGRVNWACGNVQVSLPSTMPPQPPRNIGFISFALIKVGDGLRVGLKHSKRIPGILARIHNELLSGDDGIFQVYVLLVCGFIFVGLLFMMILDIIFYTREPVMCRLWISVTVPLGVVYYIYLSYKRWQKQWGGEMS